ncbi:MAG TPA: hypothetical protein VFP84_16375 [Kofleriaceae bacterium]|nr:hypothetical protein [Kofleriaceae bacterium]
MQRGVVGGLGIIAVLGIACAASRPSPSPLPPPALAAADADVLAGCFDCLRAAQATYRRAASPLRLFETDVLLVLRERELGLPASDALAEARRLAPRLPAAADAPGVLDVLDEISMSELAASPPTGPHLGPDFARAPELRARLARAALRPAVRTYLQLAFACDHPSRRPTPLAADAPPIVQYRAQLCQLGSIDALAAVRTREPRFVETSLFIASTELLVLGGAPTLAAHLADVTARFPDASAVSFLVATYAQSRGDEAGALAGFERTLALHPGHTWAMLGRLVALSHLGRARDAIDAATQLIALDRHGVADAFYWRAFNARALHLADDARRDIAAAAARSNTPDIRELSGELALDRDELDFARAELDEAIALDAARCDARWYLAVIAHRRRAWPAAAHGFEAAMTCYDQRTRITAARREIVEQRENLSPDDRARALAALDASIASDTRQQHVAAVAAAGCALAAHDEAGARRLLDLAGDEPTLAAAIGKLRGRLAH